MYCTLCFMKRISFIHNVNAKYGPKYFMQNKSLCSSLLLGQQCDNNFLRTAENTPCNHLNNVVERDDNKYKRPDMIAYTFDEVLTRPPQQREQSSGHLSFATRYNSREKRNNNQHNEFDNNNDDNDMPIDKKCSRKIEKKKEDGYAQIAERTSKHHKVECSNDIHSWRRAIEREEKDNQPSRHRTRYKQPISHQSSKISI